MEHWSDKNLITVDKYELNEFLGKNKQVIERYTNCIVECRSKIKYYKTLYVTTELSLHKLKKELNQTNDTMGQLFEENKRIKKKLN